MTRRFVLALGLALLAVPLVTATDLHMPTPEQRLTAEQPSAFANFGYGVAIEDDQAAILDDEGHLTTWTRSGEGWRQTDDLTGTDADAIDLDLPHLVARSPDIDPKAVLVYEQAEDGTWSLDQTVASPADHDANFGTSASLDGDTLAVGANRYTLEDGTRTGAVYTFTPNQTGVWTHEATLIPKDEPDDTRFGRNVALAGDVIVSGAPKTDPHGTNSGSAYVFERTEDGGWTQTTELVAPDGEAGEFLGAASVAVYEDTIAVAVTGHNQGDQENVGAVQVFERSADGSWTSQQRLTAPDGQSGDWLGMDVAITENRILAGTGRHTGQADETGGAIYVYEDLGERYVLANKLVDGTLTSDGSLGEALAVDNGTVVGGSGGTNVDGERNAGAVYVYEGVAEQVCDPTSVGEDVTLDTPAPLAIDAHTEAHASLCLG